MRKGKRDILLFKKNEIGTKNSYCIATTVLLKITSTLTDKLDHLYCIVINNFLGFIIISSFFVGFMLKFLFVKQTVIICFLF